MANPSGNVGPSEPSTPTPSKQLTARRELTTSPEEEVGQAVPMTPPVEQGRLPTSSSSLASSDSVSGQQTRPEVAPTPTESPTVDEPTIRDVLKQALMRRLTGRGGRGRSGQRST